MIKKIFLPLFALLLCAAAFGQSADLAAQKRLMGLKMQGLIPFRFASAADGTPIAGARVEVEGIGVFSTSAEGIISFPEQEDGFYTLTFSKPGFVTASFPFEIKLSNVFTNRYSIPPLAPGAYYRIVLDWGERPADLDLHFEKQGGYHISFRNMHSAEDGSAVLDRDDQDGFGPETITVAEADAGSLYSAYVIDYTNEGNSGSRELARSGAAVYVYGRSGFLRAFRVPANRTGDKWEVFRIAGGEISGN
jgi:hypothetical protein